MYRTKKFLIPQLFIFLGVLICNGQNTNYKFKHLSTADGLSQSSVIAIEQDSFGQMWLGTRDGLNLYNSHGFKIFRNSPGDSTSISNSDILAITEDSKGNIWIGTYNGLNKYDPELNEFIRYFHSNNPNSLSNNTVWCIKEVANGDLWIGTSNGLSVYDRKTGDFTNFYRNTVSADPLPSNYILDISQTPDGSIWIGTSKGFCKVMKDEDNHYTFKSFIPEFDSTDLFVQDIEHCEENVLCVGTRNKGLLKFDIGEEKFTKFDNDNIDTDIRAIELDQEGKLWLGTANGLSIVHKNGLIQNVKNIRNVESSLSHDYIKTVFSDKKGSVWIGSYHGGVDIWDDSNANFINYTNTDSQNSLGHNVVSSIAQNVEKRIFIGTEGGGITIFKDNGSQAEYLNKKNTPKLKSNNVKSLLVDNSLLWIGSFNRGVNVYNLNSRYLDSGILSKDLTELLENIGVYAIERGKENIVWLGTFGKGVVQYNRNTEEYKSFENRINDYNSLSSNRVRNLLLDKESNLWVGTQSGLNLIEYSVQGYHEKKIKRFFYDNETISGDDILTIFEDSEGKIWVGIRAKGLFKYEKDGFKPVSIDADRTITSIYAILEDNDSNLWLSSNQGIINYNKNTQISTIYDLNDGLVGNEFNSGAALKTADSRLYFGGPSGISSFYPSRLKKNTYAPKVILTDLKVRNKSISPSDDEQILQKSIRFTESLTLDYNKANFTIDFAMPNYINPGSNQYSYRMIGLQDNWTTTSQTQASFTIQRPGDYIFEVMAANNDGVWNTDPAKLKIEVKPSPWRSGWAFLLYTLIILSALLGLGNIIRSRTRLKHQLELEHVENERNQAVNDAKLQFFTNISHEFRTPLTLITGPLQQLLEDYKGSSFVYKKLLVIESNANHLLQLINRLMDFRKLENKQYKLEVAQGNIVKFLKEIYLSFSEFAKGGDYRYNFSTEEDKILVFYDRPKLEQVFYNLISNAFKYTPKGGLVTLNIKKTDKRVVIDVRDSGPGIPAKYKDKVFDRFFEIPKLQENQAQGKGTGIGLSIAQSIVELHKGSISVLKKKRAGSTFRVKLRLGKNHLEPGQIIKDFRFSDDLDLYTSQLEDLGEQRTLVPQDLLMDSEKDTVLVVEDNEPLRFFIRDLLRETYNIIEAGNGKEAMEKALHHIPDLIVSDVIMPEMVGTELCSKIKENLKTSHIPVILLTSRTSLLYKFEGLESGADDYISKPFNVKEFRLRINNMIDSGKRLRTKFSKEGIYTPSEITVSSIDEKLLKKALQIVEDNISNDQFDIPTFSFELGVSRTLLFTKIKAWTNFTPNEFIQEIRMKRAAQLLEQNKLNISQVSYQVGFKNPRYFSKCFHKKFGETPSQYMEKFSGNILD